MAKEKKRIQATCYQDDLTLGHYPPNHGGEKQSEHKVIKEGLELLLTVSTGIMILWNELVTSMVRRAT